MPNDMRDKLADLIQDSVNGCARHWAEIIADHLIANGVILPPCKVGDTVYRIFECEIRELRVISYSVMISENISQMTIHTTNHRGAVVSFEWRDLGKTVFLTKEDAEKALKDGTDK